MKIYRVAPFGCRAYHEHPRSEVVELCDLVLELLATLGDELGVAGRQVMEILMGIFESCAYGRRVEVPQKDCSHPLLLWREQAGLELPAVIPWSYGESGSKPKTAASAEFD
jgi:hypothetical protein